MSWDFVVAYAVIFFVWSALMVMIGFGWAVSAMDRHEERRERRDAYRAIAEKMPGVKRDISVALGFDPDERAR